MDEKQQVIKKIEKSLKLTKGTNFEGEVTINRLIESINMREI